MARKHCCTALKEIVEHGHLGITYVEVFREYLIAGVGPMPRTSLLMQYCPFCGSVLPQSGRQQWMVRYEEMVGNDYCIDDIFSMPEGTPDALRQPHSEND